MPEETPVVTEPIATGTDPVVDPFDNPDANSFPREYVEKLRGESAKYRTEAKKYKEAFTGFPEDAESAVLQVAQLMVTNPAEAGKVLRDWADTLSPEDLTKMLDELDKETGEVTGPATPPEPVDYAKTAREEAERLYNEKEQARVLETTVQNIKREASELGYPEGDVDHMTLLLIANEQTNGNLAEAAKILDTRNEKIIQTFLEKKDSNNRSFVKPSTGDSPGEKPTVANGFKDARSRLEARLAATKRGGDK